MVVGYILGKSLTWLRGPCRGQGAIPTEILRKFAEKDLTELSIAFYRARLVEVHECSYKILEYFEYLENPRFFRDLSHIFDEPEYLELYRRTQLEAYWKIIFNISIQALQESNKRSITRYSSTSLFTMKTLTKPWSCLIGCFFNLYIS